MKLEVLNIAGQPTGKNIELNSEIFEVEPNNHVIYLDVKQILANRRQGTHKAKRKHEVSRTTKKLKKQKGTGGARAGSMKSPLFKGGGRAHGPLPRDYSFKINKKVKRLAQLSALSYKAQDNNIVILEDFQFEVAKTKKYIDILNSLSIGTDTRSLLVVSNLDKSVINSVRNIQKAEVIQAQDLNTYSILKAKKIIFVESALEKASEHLKKKRKVVTF